MVVETFTPEQVAALHRSQFGPWGPPIGRQEGDPPPRMHPYTCPSRGDGRHFENGKDHGILIPTVRGWICQCCDYTQDWAHDFMKTKPPAIGTSATGSATTAAPERSPEPRS